MVNQVIKEQFNKQAENFANWSVSKNEEYLEAYINFCGIKETDIVLDVACGPGDFVNYIAKDVFKAQGVDISDKEIEIAKKRSEEFGFVNTGFDCHDVESLPYIDNSYSLVVCKSAFHHFVQHDKIFREMIRCCKDGGQISIQDIRAYNDEYVNTFFETFDKLIDPSHNKTLSENEFYGLYKNYGIEITGDFKVEVDLNINEYINHAVQDESSRLKIKELLEQGKKDSKIKEFLFETDNELFFKRPVFLIIGTKY